MEFVKITSLLFFVVVKITLLFYFCCKNYFFNFAVVKITIWLLLLFEEIEHWNLQER